MNRQTYGWKLFGRQYTANATGVSMPAVVTGKRHATDVVNEPTSDCGPDSTSSDETPSLQWIFRSRSGIAPVLACQSVYSRSTIPEFDGCFSIPEYCEGKPLFEASTSKLGS